MSVNDNDDPIKTMIITSFNSYYPYNNGILSVFLETLVVARSRCIKVFGLIGLLDLKLRSMSSEIHLKSLPM